MPRFKVTFGLVNNVYGASESYISRELTAESIGPAVQQLIDVRNVLLSTVVEWTGVRIGLADGSRASSFYPPGTYSFDEAGVDLTVPAQGTQSSTNPNKAPDHSRSSLQLRVVYNGGRSTTRYLSFAPDAVIATEPGSYVPAQSPGWATAFASFANELTKNEWAIRERDRKASFGPKSIVSWVQSATAPLNLGVEVLSSEAPTVTKTDYVRISGVRRRGTDKTTYNGRYKVADINTTLIPDSVVIFLATTETGDPASVKIPGKITTERFIYEPMLNVFVVRGGMHKRGRPFGSPRGRSSTRVKLDP